MKSLLSTGLWGRKYESDDPFRSPPKSKTVDSATPEDVEKRKAARIVELKRLIDSYKGSIASFEAELRQWGEL